MKKLAQPVDLSKVEYDENTDAFKLLGQAFSQICPSAQNSDSTSYTKVTRKNLFSNSKTNILNKNRKSSSTPVLTTTESNSASDLTYEHVAPQEYEQEPNLSIQTLSSNTCENKLDTYSTNTLNDEAFRSYFMPNNESKKILRHLSLQNNHDKSQSTNNLLLFDPNQMQLTAVSEPNVLLDDSQNQKKTLPASSSSSSYFPLEPTMEECAENLDISYETKQDEEAKSSTEDLFSKNLCTLINKSDLKQILSKEEEADEKEESICPSDIDMFSNLFSKENSQDLELLLSTFSLFSNKKSHFNSLFESLSSLKSLEDSKSSESEISNQV